MELLDQKTDKELILSVIGELAKARNELNCCRGDVDKAQSRLGFLVMVVNRLLERQKD